MITYTAITSAPTQLSFGTDYLLRFLDQDSNPIYHIGQYIKTDADGDHYEYSLPTNKEPLMDATHFTEINEPV